ncbi:uncharacterized protein LOC110099979 [Dendrobium catenatum]|uniref:uncharacterized protein LOC110099979 n=1 Tax=Dendrobium catenatum TaxID=906689 RepID=UPI0009F51A87|nr:uncharacterized protein LOC110099979 [Dendrobium catenatum]
MSSILFWNCRGARKKQTGHYLRSLISNNEVNFVGLIETMVQDFSRLEINKLIGCNWDFFHVPAVGKSGGMLALWRKDTVQFEVVMTMEQEIVGNVVLPNLQKWGIVIVYASKEYHTRRLLWNQIGPLVSSDLPIIVRGDFNCCLNQGEKTGGRKFSYTIGAQEMADFMFINDMHDLGFMGQKYTWSNNKSSNSKIWVRLDRVLMNSIGLRLAPLATVKHLIRIASYHCPLMLNLAPNELKNGTRWLRFEDIWITYPATWKIVWSKWHKQGVGQPDEILNRTLKALFFWSQNRLKELGELKIALESRIKELQMIECSADGLNEEQDGELRRNAGELNSTLARLATWWRQRAKIKWIEEGDANSHFFHSNASGRRRGNRIMETQKQNGECVDDPNLIQKEFWHFFVSKWKERQIYVMNWHDFSQEIGSLNI